MRPAAHRIAVLENGRIIESGLHAQLMKQNGLYARLYSMQFRNPEEELAALLAKAQAVHPAGEIPSGTRAGILGLLRGKGI